MQLQTTSESVQNYLKAIQQIDTRGQGATQQEIALHVGVSAPGVTKMLRYLHAHHLIQYAPYRPVYLTDAGRNIALEVIRHHRLLELYLVQTLGYGWEQVHAEAERLEHHISEDFEASIERALNYPQFDPHGDPIPTRDGILPPPVLDTLDEQAVGDHVIVRRVADEDPSLLIYIRERGLLPGTEITLTGREPFGGPLTVCVAGSEHHVTPTAARSIFIERRTSP